LRPQATKSEPAHKFSLTHEPLTFAITAFLKAQQQEEGEQVTFAVKPKLD
jgi:hypothetical protein